MRKISFLTTLCMTVFREERSGSRSTGTRLACAVLLLAGAWMPVPRTMYAQQAPTEYQVKAAYLFNFLKFVDWPNDPPQNSQKRWVIGVLGDNPIGEDLSQLVAGKTVQGRELQVKIFQSAEDARGCHILFISPSEKKRLPSILANLQGSSVLTVADMDDFVKFGGMIQFVMENSRVRLAIDVGAAVRERLKISSKLLALARTVTSAERGGNN